MTQTSSSSVPTLQHTSPVLVSNRCLFFPLEVLPMPSGYGANYTADGKEPATPLVSGTLKSNPTTCIQLLLDVNADQWDSYLESL